MVQITVEIKSGDCREWAIVELQGNLETKSQSTGLNGKCIGELHFTPKGVPVFVVGHHILYGKVTSLEKPILVLNKSSTEDAGYKELMMETAEADDEPIKYLVRGVIKKKLIFKTRPKPIITNVPKKI